MTTPSRPSPDAPLPRRCGLCGEWHTRPSLTCAKCDNLRRCALCDSWHRRERLLCARCDRAVRLDELVELLDDQHRTAEAVDALLVDLAAAHSEASAANLRRDQLLADERARDGRMGRRS